ncbi:MAG: M23 family metallopeptidase [Bacteroidetes bacterium]|nr:M23 family metallopeptidase [Bacteroidota bacterium]
MTRLLLFFCFTSTLAAWGQAYQPKSIDYDSYDFHPPMKIDLILAGNFGEMRDNHFHTGLDLKTGGVEGQRLYAIEDGYISRIRISPWGYGLALYIDHPNGLSSLYGHMQSFSAEIDSLAYEKQKKNESYILDEFVLEDSIFVKKGQFIGLSGNSGSSSAAHLHFEIRETATEHALNPLLFTCFRSKIADTTRPTITGIKLYAVTEKGYMIPGKSSYYPCKLVGEKLVVNEGNPIDVSALLTENSYLAFGFQTTDKLNGAGNVCGIYHTNFTKDDTQLHEMKIDYLNFDHNRFLNTHQDYFEFDQNNKHIHKHFKTIINPLAIYVQNNGIIRWENCAGNYNLTATDVHGNKTILAFALGKPSGSYAKNPFDKTAGYFFPDSVNVLLKDDFQVLMEPATFYEPLQKLFKRDTVSTYITALYQFGEYAIPVQQKFDVRIKVPALRADFPVYKLAIGLINDKEKLTYIGGDYVDGWVEGAPRNFGKFVLVVDTLAPLITPLDFMEGKIITKFKNLQLEIADNLSGVSSYKAYLNGKWVLMEYDRRQMRYIIPLDKHSTPLLRTGNNKLRVVARDAKGNESEMGWTVVY